MSLELVKEAFKVNNLVGEDTVQTIIENDIIVPDTKPDIARVLLLDGDVFVTGNDLGTDRAVVSGFVVYKILFISDDEIRSVKSITANIPFSYTIDIPGARNGMKCRTRGTIEHMDYTMLNGRKINVKAIVPLSCKVYDEIDREFAAGITGIDEVQILTDTVQLNTHVGSNKINYIIKEDMELPSGKPSIKEILRNDVKITGKDFKISDDKVIVKGDINISTLYTADDENRSMQYMENEVSFTQFVELENMTEDTMVSVDYDLLDYKIDAFEDSDGELRNIRTEIGLNIYVSGTCYRDIEILSDAYASRSKITFEKQMLSVEEVVTENNSQIVIKDTLDLGECNPEVSEIFNILCRYNVSDTAVEDGRVVIEGTVENNILYLANNADQPVFCQKKEIPFRHVAEISDITTNMKADVRLDIEHCNYSMITSNQVEVRTVLAVNINVAAQKVFPVINKASESPIDEKKILSRPSVIIYITQPGDSLWKIAKKYGTTVDNLLRINNLSETDVLMPGQQIIILKQAV